MTAEESRQHRLKRLKRLKRRKPSRRGVSVRVIRMSELRRKQSQRRQARRSRMALRNGHRRMALGARRRTTRPTIVGWQWHRVRKGETLWSLAERYLGDGRRYRTILCANKKRIKHPNRLYANQRIRVPRRLLR